MKKKLAKAGLWLLTVLIAFVFINQGYMKLFTPEPWVDRFAGWGYAPWFLTLIGVLEGAGGIAILFPRVAPYAAGLIGAVMLGALATHLRAGEPFIGPIVMLLVLSVIAWARRPGKGTGRAETRPG